jgi:hypothetical protein
MTTEIFIIYVNVAGFLKNGMSNRKRNSEKANNE